MGQNVTIKCLKIINIYDKLWTNKKFAPIV